MTLQNSLYNINTLKHEGGTITTTLLINAQHSIFAGHFPGQPVLPGACMLQIIKEVLEQGLNHQLQLSKANTLKFLQLVDPHSINTVQLNIKYNFDDLNQLQVNGTMLANKLICFKFQGEFACY